MGIWDMLGIGILAGYLLGAGMMFFAVWKTAKKYNIEKKPTS